MKKITFTTSLVLGHIIVFTLVSVAGVFVLDNYEIVYGKAISFMIALMFIALGVIVTGIGFGIGVAVSNWVSKYWVGVLAGGIFAGFIIILTVITDPIIQTTGIRQIALFGTWLVDSFAIPIFASKLK